MTLLSPKITVQILRITLAIQALVGITEAITANTLYLLSTHKFGGIIKMLTARTDLIDRYDVVINFIIRTSSIVTPNTRVFIYIYLLSHSVIKLAMVVALFARQLWAYPVAAMLFSLFAAYQMHRYTYTHSLWLIFFAVIDFLLIIFVMLEYQNLLKQKNKPVEDDEG